MKKIFTSKKELSNPFQIQEGRIKNGRLDNFSYRRSWTEESFIKEQFQGDTMGESFNFSRVKYLLIFITFFILLLVGRIAWLQVAKGDYYYSLAEGNRIRIERIEPKRGIIYDKNNIPLVRNVANFLLYFVPADLPKDQEEKNSLLEGLSNLLNITLEEINQKLSTIKPRSLESYQPMFIADNIEYETAMEIYIKSKEMPGVFLSNKTRREYNLFCSSLSHVLGYIGKIDVSELKKYGDEYQQIDYIGKTGLEYFWENELKGVSGKKQIEVDALGKEKKIMGTTMAEDGHNLILSLDIELQKKLEDTITDFLEKSSASKASAIIMNPQNGEILSLVSIPAYNNNFFARGIKQEEYSALINNPDNPLFNRSIGGEFPSGSTVKPIIAAAALEEKVISENTSFLSSGGLRISQWFFPDWRSGGHGVTDVRKAIAQSVNTFFYIIGGGYEDFQGLGVDRIIKYAKLFGLSEQTGIDLPGEASGFLPSKEWKEETKGEAWYIGNTYHLSIGQGDLLATPLQVAQYTSYFANGGKLYRPHLVTDILNSNDELLKKVDPELLRENIIDPYNLYIIKGGMRQAVVSGSAQSLNQVPVEVAGKTGTAQWSSKKENHAWFTGFAPYNNAELVITVLIEEGGEGSVAAVPIAKEVLTWYFSGRPAEEDAD